MRSRQLPPVGTQEPQTLAALERLLARNVLGVAHEYSALGLRLRARLLGREAVQDRGGAKQVLPEPLLATRLGAWAREVVRL